MMLNSDGTEMTEKEIQDYYQKMTEANLSPKNYDNLSLQDKLIYKAAQNEILLRREEKARRALELACEHIAHLYYADFKDPWFYDEKSGKIIGRDEFEDWFLSKAEEER